LAGSNEFSGDGIFRNETISQRGDLWVDQPNTESGGFDSGEHSGGLREADSKRIPIFSVNSKRISERTGNAFADSKKNSVFINGSNGEYARKIRHSGTPLDSSPKVAGVGIGEWGIGYSDTPHPTPYTPFPGICLTDTFQLGETAEGENLFSEIFPQNSARVIEQSKTPLRVIMGNPPYSVGQKSANDNAQNQSYPKLEARIAETYVAASEANLNKAAYDTYIKAFRWSTDRLDPKNGGIIGFVSNGSWLDSNGLDGFRKCLEREFSSIYVYNLRGNQRTSGELSRKEGGKIFGSGSRTPVAVTILVKRGKSG
jgi:hypothetical protein